MITIILMILVSLLHFYFFILEAFLWNKPKGLKVFRMDQEHADKTRTLALNQGVYNLFISTGILFMIFGPGREVQRDMAFFFLCFIIIAGVVGGLTVSRKIFYIQAVPAILALAALSFSI